jgi:hypothetical protein
MLCIFETPCIAINFIWPAFLSCWFLWKKNISFEWKLEFRYNVQKVPATGPGPEPDEPIPTFFYRRPILIICFHPYLGHLAGHTLPCIAEKPIYVFIFVPMHAACPPHSHWLYDSASYETCYCTVLCSPSVDHIFSPLYSRTASVRFSPFILGISFLLQTNLRIKS